jgi:hypothetical protein
MAAVLFLKTRVASYSTTFASSAFSRLVVASDGPKF